MHAPLGFLIDHLFKPQVLPFHFQIPHQSVVMFKQQQIIPPKDVLELMGGEEKIMAKRKKNRNQKPRPQILMILVEGETEMISLLGPVEALVNEYAADLSVKFVRLSRDKDGGEISGGDTTSDYGIYPGNYDKMITERVMKDLTVLEGLLPKYIVKVVQIIDMDGTYVDSERIVPKHSPAALATDRVYYSEYEIEAGHTDSIISRHGWKQTNIDYLVAKKSIKLGSKTVPYSVYFNSCNLEHFLWGERNIPQEEKRGRAEAFSLRCQEDDSFFRSVVFGDYSLSQMNYQESWNYIRSKGTNNSLSRCSNLNLMMEDIRLWAMRQYR